MSSTFFNFVFFPTILLVPLCVWLLAARLLSLIAPFTIIPTIIFTQRFCWALPILPEAWKSQGWLRGSFSRLGFKYAYFQTLVRRFLTLPLRPYTPQAFIVGFPRCGTTTLATHLQRHPEICFLDGMPWHPLLSIESHFFNGVLGRNSATSPTLYRSFFPTVLTRWYRRVFRRAGAFICVDACPLTACLPYTAKRMAAISPGAKLVFVVRDPVDAAFSTEIMLRNLGYPLTWSLMEDLVAADPRFSETLDDARFWEALEALEPGEPLPEDLPARLFGRCSTVLRCTTFVDRIQPFLQHFGRQQIMFVEYEELRTAPEETVAAVIRFIGGDPEAACYRFSSLPDTREKAVWDKQGRRMHPAVRRKLSHYFAVHNQRLFALVGREFPWWGHQDEEEGFGRDTKLARHGQPIDGLLQGPAVLSRKDSGRGLVQRVVSVNAKSGLRAGAQV